MTATHDKNFGIQLEETLITDLDFADDIALLEDNINLAQDFLDRVCHTAAAAGRSNPINAAAWILWLQWTRLLYRAIGAASAATYSASYIYPTYACQ